jgi:dolichol-phosphate mannosyltransferase
MVLCLKTWKSRSLPGFYLFTINNFPRIDLKQMNNFSIVIPIFNEGDNIVKLVHEIFKSLNSNIDNFEINLVDDASTDKTLTSIKILKDIYSKKIKIISNEKNIGQSFSIIEGIKQSSYNTIVTLDGDGQNNPKDIPILLNYYFLNKDIYLVGGIRKKRRDSFLKKLSSRIANSVRKTILNDKCIDTGCSLKVFDKKIFMKFEFFNGIHRFIPALFVGYGKKTFFIDVDHRPRIYGYSKYGTFGRLFRGIKDLIKVAKIIKKLKSNRD